MQHYKIDKRDNQWAVSVDGKDMLYFKQKKWAVRIAKLANEQFQTEHADEGDDVAPLSDIH